MRPDPSSTLIYVHALHQLSRKATSFTLQVSQHMVEELRSSEGFLHCAQICTDLLNMPLFRKEEEIVTIETKVGGLWLVRYELRRNSIVGKILANQLVEIFKVYTEQVFSQSPPAPLIDETQKIACHFGTIYTGRLMGDDSLFSLQVAIPAALTCEKFDQFRDTVAEYFRQKPSVSSCAPMDEVTPWRPVMTSQWRGSLPATVLAEVHEFMDNIASIHQFS